MSKWISVSFLHLHQHIDPLKCNFQNIYIKKKDKTTNVWNLDLQVTELHHFASMISLGGEGSPQA